MVTDSSSDRLPYHRRSAHREQIAMATAVPAKSVVRRRAGRSLLRRVRRWARDPAFWLSGGLVLWLAVCSLWIAIDWGGPVAEKVFGLYYDLPVGPILCYLCWRAARHPASTGGASRGWQTLGVGYLIYWFGNCTWNVYEGILDIDPFPSIADVFFLAFYPLAIFGLSQLTERLASPRDRKKFLLDCSCAALSAVGIMWYLGLRHVEIDAAVGIPGLIVSVGYPIVDVMLLIAVLSALLKRHHSGFRLSLWILASSYIAMLCGDLIFLIPALENAYSSGGLADVFFKLSYALAACAASYRIFRRRDGSQRPTRDRTYQFQSLPYFSAVAVYALLVWEIREHWSSANGILTLIAVSTTGLVIARQLLATREIAELSAAKATLVSEARYKSLVKNSSDIVLVLDDEGRITFATPSILHVLGITPEEGAGQLIADLTDPNDAHVARQFCHELSEDPALAGPVEWRLRSADGQIRHVEVLGSNLLADRSVEGLVLNLRDITERRRLEEELKHLAFTDTLTLLANRNLFNEQLGLALTRCARGKVIPVLIFVDLDNFKKINDTLGHEAGDKILTMAAQRLIRATRSSDIVARLGGDEFAVLIADEASDAYIKALAERLIDLLSTPFELNGRQLKLSASLGIAQGENGMTPQDFMRNADLAMYRAKAQGKNCYEMYQPAMYANLLQTVDLEAEMTASLDRKDFVPYFQPIIDLATLEIVGFEALIRWHHPGRGILFPNTFIQIAEDSGLIKRLGREVLFETCRHAAEWLEDFPADRLAHVAINVSGRQLEHGDLVSEVRSAIATHNLDPSIIVLEITESVLMQNVGLAIEQLTRLKKLGVRIALDDFGTGYSSLSHVHRFPIDILKIDRSFIEGLDKQDGSALVRAIMGLANALELEVVAEGIEKPGQLAALQQLACPLGQGYYFGKPESPEKTRQLLVATAQRSRLSLVKSDGSIPRPLRSAGDSVPA